MSKKTYIRVSSGYICTYNKDKDVYEGGGCLHTGSENYVVVSGDTIEELICGKLNDLIATDTWIGYANKTNLANHSYDKVYFKQNGNYVLVAVKLNGCVWVVC